MILRTVTGRFKVPSAVRRRTKQFMSDTEFRGPALLYLPAGAVLATAQSGGVPERKDVLLFRCCFVAVTGTDRTVEAKTKENWLKHCAVVSCLAHALVAN